ncbi:MAG TPA: OsmC family protein [Anaerolineales bacterium]|nr:MAG: peroxiredoxin [Chloroflexi bacterium RBG_19FT_COMBO_62_14]HLE03373.1 OsmC family protein [Anaerolineales bacterium]
MQIRKARAVWDGGLKEGSGRMSFGDGLFEGKYTWSSRFEEADGTNPEELIAAAHAGCFSMALSSRLGKAGYISKHIQTTAELSLDTVQGERTITRIVLNTEAEVPGIDESTFLELAEKAKKTCPVSRALGGVEITLQARLLR